MWINKNIPFLSDWQKNIFLVCHRTLVISLCVPWDANGWKSLVQRGAWTLPVLTGERAEDHGTFVSDWDYTLESPFLRVHAIAILNNFHLLHFSSLKVDILFHDVLWPLIILMESEKTLNISKTESHMQKAHLEQSKCPNIIHLCIISFRVSYQLHLEWFAVTHSIMLCVGARECPSYSTQALLPWPADAKSLWFKQ